jgi:hypothetical protein
MKFKYCCVCFFIYLFIWGERERERTRQDKTMGDEGEEGEGGIQ